MPAARAAPPPLPSLLYKVDTSRPSLRTNWTRLDGDKVKRLLLKLDGATRRCEALEDSEEALRTKAAAAEGRAKQVEGVITSFEMQLRQGAEEAAALKKRLAAAEHDAEALLAQVAEQEAAREKVEDELLAKLKKMSPPPPPPSY